MAYVALLFAACTQKSVPELDSEAKIKTATRFLQSEMTCTNSSHVPQWLEEAAPELDAAVVVPVEVGTFGPSLAVELRLLKLNVVTDMADFFN